MTQSCLRAIGLSSVLFVAVALGQGGKPLPGAVAKLGTPYKLGKAGDELQFTLEKVEFATRFMTDQDTYMADKEHRLLVISFAVQNPQKSDESFNENSLKFTVVSPDDENFTANTFVYHPERRNALNMALKPVQKVRAVVYLPIHPQGPVNKLMVQRGTGTSVLRYDLHQLVKPLTGPYAADNGMGSVDPGVAAIKVPFELGPFDYTLDSIEEMPKVGDFDPGDGQKVIVLRMTLKDVSLLRYWATETVTPKLTDEDGNDLRFVETLKNSSDEHLHTNPEPGDEIRFRFLFYAPATAKLKKLTIFSSLSGRTVVIPLATSTH